jgi:small subunit ribosomal protein S3
MGQKVNPNGFRIGVNRTWDSRWFSSDRNYADTLHQDIEIRKYLMKKLKQAGIAKVIIERMAKTVRITVHASRPGIIIGKRGEDIEKLKKDVSTRMKQDAQLNIVEIRKPELDAKLVADSIAEQMERRVSYKRAMKRAMQSALRMGAEGIRVLCSGRLGGAEIARDEEYREGRVPLHTLRANVDYGTGTAYTTYGTCGVKVWIFKGEIMEHNPYAQEQHTKDMQSNR